MTSSAEESYVTESDICSHDLNPRDFCLPGTLKEIYVPYVKNPQSSEEFQGNIWQGISSVPLQ
jgi:hypothetical protein